MNEIIPALENTVDQRPGISILLGAALITVILWQLPFGKLILYPFTVLAVWFHEMGHGLTAMAMGGSFQKLELWPNGSGLATYQYPVPMGGVRRALIAAGGPLGPPLAGSLLILSARRPDLTYWALMILGIVLLLSVLIWVRTFFGIAMVTAFGAMILALAQYGTPWGQNFAVQFLGVQACVSTYHQLSYLFSSHAIIDGQRIPSDTSQMAQALCLPYWFWGALLAAASAALLVQSLRMAVQTE